MGVKALTFLSGKDPGEERREEACRLLVSSIKKIGSLVWGKEGFPKKESLAKDMVQSSLRRLL